MTIILDDGTLYEKNSVNLLKKVAFYPTMFGYLKTNIMDINP